MIDRLVKSALQTGWLSVESEGLIRQVLAIRGYQSADLAAIEILLSAVQAGQIQREGSGSLNLTSVEH